MAKLSKMRAGESVNPYGQKEISTTENTEGTEEEYIDMGIMFLKIKIEKSIMVSSKVFSLCPSHSAV